MIVGKNVSLKIENLEVVIGYTNKTRKNFSQTLNIIIEEWDKYSLLIQKIKDQEYLKNLQKAEVIK